jgi:hypothetical protein
MGLVELINANRISLPEIPLEIIKPDGLNEGIIKGAIAEKLVEIWLSNTPDITFDQELPRNVNGYKLYPKSHGIGVYEKDKMIHEYDFLVYHKSSPIIVEVKSLKLNGVINKIERGFKIAQEIYDRQDISMLLFFPMYTNKIKDAEKIEEQFPNVHCIDLGYKKKQLNNTLKRYYQYLSNG